MAGGKRGPNAKQVAGREKKAENEARKQAEVNRQREAAEAASWKQGSNTRKATRDEAAALKADEAARKRQEKAALLAAEEQEMAAAGKPKGTKKPALSGGGAKKKGGKKNDLALLEDALVKSADKKVKKRKEEAMKKQQQQQQQQVQAKQTPSSGNVVPASVVQRMIGDNIGDSDDADVGRQANVARMQDQGASGIDAALGSLDISAGPKKSAKVLYNEFEERMMPTMKEDYPGLRLTQYKEKIWALWKKSPENPANQEVATPTNS